MAEDNDKIENKDHVEIDPDEQNRQADFDVPRTPEAIIKQKVIKLFNTEKEIAELATMNGTKNRTVKDFFVNTYKSGFLQIELFTPEIKTETDFGGSQDVRITFDYNPDDIADNSELVGIKTQYSIKISLYTDLETRDKFLEYAKSAPGHGNPVSIYFLSEDGTYGKIQQMNGEFESGRGRLFDTSFLPVILSQGINSSMEPEDFELVQTALELIKSQLITSEPNNLKIPPSR